MPPFRRNRRARAGLRLACALALAAGPATAAGPEGDGQTRFGKGITHVGVLAGHAWSLKRYHGARDVDAVRYVPIASDWGIGLSDAVGGDAWYRGNWELLVEGTALVATERSSGYVGGGGLLLRYNWLRGERWVPFVSVGAGLSNLDFDLKSQRDGFNFLLQGGVGSHLFVSRRLALTGEWRYQHLSNAGTRRPNSGIDAGVLFFGTTWFFDESSSSSRSSSKTPATSRTAAW